MSRVSQKERSAVSRDVIWCDRTDKVVEEVLHFIDRYAYCEYREVVEKDTLGA